MIAASVRRYGCALALGGRSPTGTTGLVETPEIIEADLRPRQRLQLPGALGVEMAQQPPADAVEKVVAPVAIERALSIYQQLQERDQSVLLQARKILTQHIYGMVDRGECDEQRLTVAGSFT